MIANLVSDPVTSFDRRESCMFHSVHCHLHCMREHVEIFDWTHYEAPARLNCALRLPRMAMLSVYATRTRI